MAACKCRYCQSNLMTDEAYKVVEDKKKAYFCNQEHYQNYVLEVNQKKAEKENLAAQKREAKRMLLEQEKEERRKLIEQRKERAAIEDAQKEKRKIDKDKAYRLICEIIGRPEIVNTVLWKEWAIWNMVASNEEIGHYLEDNKEYLKDVISRIDDITYSRIKYLSAILKNHLGDISQKAKESAKPKPKVKVEETIYQSSVTRTNKRRSLADLEDIFE